MHGLALSPITVASMQGYTPALDLNFLTPAECLDARITFTRASSGTRVNKSGLIESISTDRPRFDYDPVTLEPRGLLIEESRTNSSRNSNCTGAAPGSPGTLPTNWSSALSGLTQEIVGSGTEAGIGYVDIRLTGTAASGTTEIRTEAATQIAATVGQTWAQSVYCKVVAGSMTGVSSFRLQTIERNSGGAFLTATNGVISAGASGQSLAACRVSYVSAIGNASTAFAQPDFLLSHAASGSIDVTIRIGGMQMELGAFATSYIPTTSASVARALDVVLMNGSNLSSWYRQGEGSIICETNGNGASGTFPNNWYLSDGTSSNRIFNFAVIGASTYVPSCRIDTAAANQTNNGASSPAILNANPLRSYTAWRQNDIVQGHNGGDPFVTGTAVLPVVDRLHIGQSFTGGGALNGHMKRLRYFRSRVPTSVCKGLAPA